MKTTAVLQTCLHCRYSPIWDRSDNCPSPGKYRKSSRLADTSPPAVPSGISPVASCLPGESPGTSLFCSMPGSPPVLSRRKPHDTEVSRINAAKKVHAVLFMNKCAPSNLLSIQLYYHNLPYKYILLKIPRYGVQNPDCQRNFSRHTGQDTETRTGDPAPCRINWKQAGRPVSRRWRTASLMITQKPNNIRHTYSPFVSFI